MINNRHWDFATVNETQRKQKEELWARTHLRSIRWIKHIKEVQHSGPRLMGLSYEKKKFRLQVSSVYFFPRTGEGDEHVQQVCSELQKHTDRCRKTNTHMLIGGDFNAQFGWNDEPEAIDSKYITRRTKQQWPVAQTLGSPTPTDTGQHILKKARLQQRHVPLN